MPKPPSSRHKIRAIYYHGCNMWGFFAANCAIFTVVNVVTLESGEPRTLPDTGSWEAKITVYTISALYDTPIPACLTMCRPEVILGWVSEGLVRRQLHVQRIRLGHVSLARSWD
ncbi:hypothetical protein BT67DRAFT_19855 [Trichocladium antarcticum]|uniref:Uncharacterized protein n=1 Tax=Trichocladium antarcticum TaxID=1450529 RepID=A0AAN6UTJ9_9PEZI|nr:hypothetical protein BT67DRAFT_19855 [Trichocladium antarcticum]